MYQSNSIILYVLLVFRSRKLFIKKEKEILELENNLEKKKLTKSYIKITTITTKLNYQKNIHQVINMKLYKQGILYD